MFRKKDMLLIAALLAIAALSYGVMVLSRGGQTLSGFVEIRVDGALYQTVPLGKAQAVRVEQENGEVNIIEIDERGARMGHSSCKNQLCVNQGQVSLDNWTRRSMGRFIICLPNRVTVELALGENAPTPDIEVPDI